MRTLKLAGLFVAGMLLGGIASASWSWHFFSRQQSINMAFRAGEQAYWLAGLRMDDAKNVIEQMEHSMDITVVTLAREEQTAPLDEMTRRCLTGVKVYRDSYPAGGDRAALINALLVKVPGPKEPPAGSPFQPGGQAPALAYARLSDSRKVSLKSEYAGKIVVLEFWATWCGPCQRAMEAMQKTAAQFAGQSDRIVFLTISIDAADAANAPATIEKVAAHVKRKGWTTTINGWSMPEEQKTWFVESVPYTYIIGADGKIVAVNPRQKLEDVIAPLLAK
jgi:thiol-disulfide isomerase/thioredoxin